MIPAGVDTILVIDDTEPSRYLVGKHLKKAGFEMVEASLGAEGLRLARELKPSLVILDVKLPDLNGYEVCRRLKDDPVTSGIPVVHISAHYETVEGSASLSESPADGYLTQPVNPLILTATVRSLIRLRRAEEEKDHLLKREKEARREVEKLVFDLRVSESKYRRLSEGNIIGIVKPTIHGEVLEANDEFLRIIGSDRSAVERGELRWDAITPPEYAELERTRIEEMLQKGSCTPYEKEYFRKDGSRVSVMIGYALIEGSTDQCIGFAVDLSERRQIEKDLRDAVQARDEFLSIASHELKTPLTSLKMQVQMRNRLLNRGDYSAFTPEKMHRLVAQDERQIERLIRLIDDMLDISRINSGKLTMSPESFDLCETVGEVVERFSNQFSMAGCPVEFSCDGSVVGSWDRYRIEQVAINLFTNAMKYGAGKPVYIRVWAEEGRAFLQVKDQGRGIAPEDQARIFQRFERAVSPSQVSGLGLGLYIVQQILEAHSGSIRVESEIGRGSTFIVELPL